MFSNKIIRAYGLEKLVRSAVFLALKGPLLSQKTLEHHLVFGLESHRLNIVTFT